MSDEVLYEVRGATAIVTMNRPEYRNAQNSVMTYALDRAFQRAVDDDDGEGDRARRRGQALLGRARHRHAGTRRRRALRQHGDHLVGPRRPRGRRPAVRARDGGLSRHVPALARDPQADDRDDPGRLHRRRVDALVRVRPHRRLRRRVLRRSGGADGDSRRRVLRAPVGARVARGQGDPVHRRPVLGTARVRVGHGQPRRRRATTSRPRHSRSPNASPRCRSSGSP